jgi:tripartite-type tricarboxylate transporter receptor subunit TctC
MTLFRRTLIASLALTSLLATAVQAAYPDQPVHIVVPYSPGGSSDVIARAIGDELGKVLGQPVIVDNRAGAGSLIGTQYVAQDPGNGYTLLMADVPFTIVPAVYKEKVRYDAEKSFAPIALLGLAPTYLFVNDRSPITTAQDLVRRAKAAPDTLSIGSGGNGSLTHLMGALFMINSGTRLTHIPYKGAAASVTDLAAGQIDMSFTTMASASALYQAGKLRPIAVSSEHRQKDTPAVPTFQEAGVPHMAVESWWGLMAPAATPKDVQATLAKAMAKVMTTTAVKARMAAVGVSPPADGSPAALQKIVRADLARWQDVVRRADIKID